jgi:hypothetical protein
MIQNRFDIDVSIRKIIDILWRVPEGNEEIQKSRNHEE